MGTANGKPTYEELLNVLLMLFWMQDGWGLAEELLVRAGRLEYSGPGTTRLVRQKDIDFYDNPYDIS